MNTCCIYCQNNNISYLDDYKFEILEDIDLLGEMKIYECQSCKFVYADPMPDINKLDLFYKKIYRSFNRPHNYDNFFKKYSYLYDINLEYLSYLTSNIQFENIRTILDFGCGLGNLGFALKKKFKHLELHCIENDENCKSVLEKRGYKNYDNISNIDKKFDLIISLHVFEHLTSLSPVNKLIKLLNKDGYLFYEVPNTDFEDGYKYRIFDTPHLIFFNEKNISRVFDDNGMKKISNLKSSYSIKHDIENQLFSINNSRNTSFLSKIKKIFKAIEPNYITDFRRKKILSKQQFSDERLKWYINGNKNSRCLRGIYQKR